MINDTDKCRALIRKLFSHSTEYHNYIETKLAGDFACELALIVKHYEKENALALEELNSKQKEINELKKKHSKGEINEAYAKTIERQAAEIQALKIDINKLRQKNERY